jgi:hypothetical protein
MRFYYQDPNTQAFHPFFSTFFSSIIEVAQHDRIFTVFKEDLVITNTSLEKGSKDHYVIVKGRISIAFNEKFQCQNMKVQENINSGLNLKRSVGF